MGDKLKNTATGAATGAAAGSVAGPWGAAAGGVIGGAIGYFGTDDEEAPTYTPDKANFTYGLGPSDGYAAEQAGEYNWRADDMYGEAFNAQRREAAQQTMPDQRAFVGSDGQQYLTGADADARSRQIAALGGIQGANGQLQQFANQAEGPSAAQGVLQQATDQAVSQQNAMARTQRGGGGAALRNAAFNNVGLQQNASAQASQLRAQEAAAHRQQQLAALGAVQQGAGMQANYTGQLRGADQGFAQAQAGQANYDAQQGNAYNQYQQGMEFQLGANNLNANMQQGQQNDSYSLGLVGASQGFSGMSDNLASNQSQMGVQYEQAKAAGAGIGSNNFNAGQQIAQQDTAMMLGAVSGGAGAIGQMNQPAAQGYGTTSDIRAKKNIRPAEVARALGGQTPEEAWAAYDRRAAGQHGTPAEQLADVRDWRARQDIDQGTAEFAPRARSSRELGRERPSLETMRALAGSRQAPVSYAFDADEPAPKVDYEFGPNEEAPERVSYAFGAGDEVADLRGAQPYEYEYKDPARHGEGSYVGPMAQDLEHLPGVVERGPDGTKAINTPRLTLGLTGAVSEQQRRMDALEARQREMLALGGPRPAAMGYGGQF